MRIMRSRFFWRNFMFLVWFVEFKGFIDSLSGEV